MNRISKGPTRTLPYAFFEETEANNRLARRRGDSFQNIPLGQFENDARLYVRVKNTTALPVRRYAILALGELVFDSASAMDDPMWELRQPTGHPLETPAVLQQAVAPGATGMAVIRGMTPALVTHTAGDDHVRLEAPGGGATEHGAQPSTGNPTRVEIVHPASTLSMVLLKSYTSGWVFKTPTGGIPARSGDACGSADCDAYWIDDDGDLVELKDFDNAQITREVWNIATGEVDEEVYIQAKPMMLKLLTDVEYCNQT